MSTFCNVFYNSNYFKFSLGGNLSFKFNMWWIQCILRDSSGEVGDLAKIFSSIEHHSKPLA